MKKISDGTVQRYFRWIVRNEKDAKEMADKIDSAKLQPLARKQVLNQLHQIVYDWMRKQALLLPSSYNSFLN